MYKIPITFQKESVFPVQRGVSACIPLRVRTPTGERNRQRCDAETAGATAAVLRARTLFISLPRRAARSTAASLFLRLGAKKLGKTFGAKKIMSTFAPVSEILLLTDTERAHMSGGIREIWANTRVAKWGRL